MPQILSYPLPFHVILAHMTHKISKQNYVHLHISDINKNLLWAGSPDHFLHRTLPLHPRCNTHTHKKKSNKNNRILVWLEKKPIKLCEKCYAIAVLNC